MKTVIQEEYTLIDETNSLCFNGLKVFLSQIPFYAMHIGRFYTIDKKKKEVRFAHSVYRYVRSGNMTELNKARRAFSVRLMCCL